MPDLTVAHTDWHHGHLVFAFRDAPDVDYYASDGTRVDSEERPCLHCGLLPHPEGPDGCLGMLPGVRFACCGHGLRDGIEPYVSFSEEGQRDAGIRRLLRQARQARTQHFNPHGLYGDDALRYFHDRGVGP